MGYAKVGDLELTYDSFGDAAAEVILLIAGLGTQMIRWTNPFCDELARVGYRVIRFDNRDAGCSTHFTAHGKLDFNALVATLMAGQRPEVPYTLYDMAADAVGLLDALAIKRAHLVGRSMGGMIAQIMASEYPERVLSLTSIMSSTGNPALPQAAPDVMASMMRPAPDPKIDEEGYLSVALAFARRIAGTSYAFDEDAHRALIRQEVHRGYDPGGTSRQIAAMAVGGDRRARLVGVSAPALVIHGSDDPLILPACGIETAELIPGAELMLIAGMGHDLPASLYPTVINAVRKVAARASRAG